MTDVLEEIRSLEQRIGYLEDCETESIRRGQRIGELEQRISKAKDILEEAHYADDPRDHAPAIASALEVLEGK